MQNIGFIGTGLMGFPMAKNILKAGYKVRAFNRSKNKAEPLKDFGAEISNSIGELVKESHVVITMLTNDDAVNEVLGSDEFLNNLKPNSTVIDMSSVKQTTALNHGKNLKSRKINYLDAPVSGGVVGAVEGTLTFMVGGDERAFNKIKTYEPDTAHVHQLIYQKVKKKFNSRKWVDGNAYNSIFI